MTDPSGAAPASALKDLPRISTGSEGLDDILGGGLDPNRMYLYEGRPGTGKTTIALQFLLRGVRDGERVLYISLSETRRELENSSRIGTAGLCKASIFSSWSRPRRRSIPTGRLTVFHPAEMEPQRNDRPDLQRGRADQSYPRRARQPVRAAPAGPEPAALPAPSAGLEALLHQPQLHCRAARRSVLLPGRSAAAFDRARRRHARANGYRLRRGAAPASRDQDARHSISRRVSRFYDLARRLADLPEARCGRASQGVPRRLRVQR